MTTKEVISAIISYPEGTKFSHPYFGNDEYIINNGGKIMTEDGYEVNEEFWSIRQDWDGWFVKVSIKEPMTKEGFVCDCTFPPAERVYAQPDTYMFIDPYYNHVNYCLPQQRVMSPKEYGQKLMSKRKR